MKPKTPKEYIYVVVYHSESVYGCSHGFLGAYRDENSAWSVVAEELAGEIVSLSWGKRVDIDWMNRMFENDDPEWTVEVMELEA